MSREIKFRAWDKVEKEMLTILEMDWYPDHAPRYLKATLRYLKAIDKDGKECYYNSPDDIRENLAIDQFTGLKDKNGKDVYEGDLLKIKYPFSDNDEVCEVKWSNSDAGFIIGNFQLWKVVPKSVVVGNVHEDKDLLEAEK